MSVVPPPVTLARALSLSLLLLSRYFSSSLPFSLPPSASRRTQYSVRLTGTARGAEGFSHTDMHWGMLTYRAMGRGSPFNTPIETQHIHLSEQRPFPGNRLPTKFLTLSVPNPRTWAAASVHPLCGDHQCRKQEGAGPPGGRRGSPRPEA